MAATGAAAVTETRDGDGVGDGVGVGAGGAKISTAAVIASGTARSGTHHATAAINIACSAIVPTQARRLTRSIVARVRPRRH